MASNTRAGYIMFECVVALSVLSVGVFAIQSGVRQTVAVRAQARDYTQARFLLEELVGKPLFQPELDEMPLTSGTFEGENSRFSWTLKIERIELPPPPRPPDPPPELANEFELPSNCMGKITATVSWTRGGNSFTETAETLVGPDQMYEPPPPPK